MARVSRKGTGELKVHGSGHKLQLPYNTEAGVRIAIEIETLLESDLERRSKRLQMEILRSGWFLSGKHCIDFEMPLILFHYAAFFCIVLCPCLPSFETIDQFLLEVWCSST